MKLKNEPRQHWAGRLHVRYTDTLNPVTPTRFRFRFRFDSYAVFTEFATLQRRLLLIHGSILASAQKGPNPAAPAGWFPLTLGDAKSEE